jgi:hypothetical protein
MDAAYCSSVLREHSRNLGHVPLIDHNPRKGEKIEFTPSEAQRYKERTQAERTNGRLKDDFGGRHVRVRGNAKVMSHLMFGILARANALKHSGQQHVIAKVIIPRSLQTFSLDAKF